MHRQHKLREIARSFVIVKNAGILKLQHMGCSVWQEDLADKAPSIGVNAEPSEGCR